jgi:hypothetical protein
LEQQLEKIHLGIKTLQELHQNALIEIELLKVQNANLQEELLKSEQKKASVSEQQLLERITENSVSGDVEKKQMKLKINELVREVDKCIALLNQ